jgi:hypothetical protein
MKTGGARTSDASIDIEASRSMQRENRLFQAIPNWRKSPASVHLIDTLARLQNSVTS